MLYKVNDKLYIRPEAVAHIKFHEGLEAYIGTMSGLNLSCTEDEGRALLEHVNGAAAGAGTSPAADQPAGKWRYITWVEKFISKSGNESWKAESDDVVVYFRQVQKEMLKEAGLWDDLNDMHIGERLKATIGLYTLPDGDLHKIVSIDPGGSIFFDNDDDDDYEEPEDEPEDVPMLGLDPKDAPTDIFVDLVKSGNFVILDTETTGLDDRAEICQIAIIDSSGKTLLDTLVKPTKPIPSQATAIHHITNDMVKTAPNFINVAQAVWDACQGKTVIVYNAEYDFRLLAQSEYACEPVAVSDWHTIKRECAMLKFAEIYGDWDTYRQAWKLQKLDTAARHYLLTVQDAHTALGDCLTTLAVCKAIANKS
jgi:DNA polymerase III subunit epsilon